MTARIAETVTSLLLCATVSTLAYHSPNQTEASQTAQVPAANASAGCFSTIAIPKDEGPFTLMKGGCPASAPPNDLAAHEEAIKATVARFNEGAARGLWSKGYDTVCGISTGREALKLPSRCIVTRELSEDSKTGTKRTLTFGTALRMVNVLSLTDCTDTETEAVLKCLSDRAISNPATKPAK